MAEALAVADHGYVPGYLCQLTALDRVVVFAGTQRSSAAGVAGQALKPACVNELLRIGTSCNCG